MPDADRLAESIRDDPPGLVLLDLDAPGRDPLDALAEVLDEQPDLRAVVFTGHVRRELVERALQIGAWGYVSKNDGVSELLRPLRQVAAGHVTLSPQAREDLRSGGASGR